MTNDLEQMLNEASEEIIAEQSEETVDKPTHRVYIHCPKCERRMYEGLFQGHAACCWCRCVDAQGNKVINKRNEWDGM